MGPFIFSDVYKDYIWGGRNLEQWGKNLPEGIVAESWEISCHPDGPSLVKNGEFQGEKLSDLIARFPVEIMGTEVARNFTDFPLLVKLIDAKNKLSVQVHPDDSYAWVHEKENGKNEMWYILWASPDARLILDVKKNVSKDRFLTGVLEGNLDECLNSVPVKQGDVIYIPAGLVHAIGAGIVLIEIQQNSNSTYRVYDYNRKGTDGKPRPLHIDKAMDVIDFQNAGRRGVYKGLTIFTPEMDRKILTASKYFGVEEWFLKSRMSVKTLKERFYLFTCIQGNAVVQWEDEQFPVEKGMSFMIPACCDNTVIVGQDCRLIVSYIPNIRRDVIKPLLSAGYDERTIIDEIPGIQGFMNS